MACQRGHGLPGRSGLMREVLAHLGSPRLPEGCGLPGSSGLTREVLVHQGSPIFFRGVVAYQRVVGYQGGLV